MPKPAHKDVQHPPGQIVNTEFHKLAVQAKDLPKAKTLGDIIDKVWKNEDLTTSNRNALAIEEAFRRGKAEGYVNGYYDGVIDERHKWLNQTYHLEEKA